MSNAGQRTYDNDVGCAMCYYRMYLCVCAFRSCLSDDSVALWERWFTHALQLLQQKVLSLNSIVQLFTPLLVHYNASYADKVALLSTQP